MTFIERFHTNPNTNDSLAYGAFGGETAQDSISIALGAVMHSGTAADGVAVDSGELGPGGGRQSVGWNTKDLQLVKSLATAKIWQGVSTSFTGNIGTRVLVGRRIGGSGVFGGVEFWTDDAGNTVIKYGMGAGPFTDQLPGTFAPEFYEGPLWIASRTTDTEVTLELWNDDPYTAAPTARLVNVSGPTPDWALATAGPGAIQIVTHNNMSELSDCWTIVTDWTFSSLDTAPGTPSIAAGQPSSGIVAIRG